MSATLPSSGREPPSLPAAGPYRISEEDLAAFFAPELSDDDLISSVHTMRIMFADEALPQLCELLENPSRSWALRELAAETMEENISGAPDGVITRLQKLIDAADESTIWLARLALGRRL